MRGALFLFVVQALLLSCAHRPGAPREDGMQTLRFPDDFRRGAESAYRQLNDSALAQASTLPPGLRVEAGALEVKPDRLLLPAALINDSAQPRALVVVAGVFSLSFAQAAGLARKLREGPPMPPPVPPPPMLLEVPAHTRVELTGQIYLPEWEYAGSPEVTLRWALELWNEPRPGGELRVKLPQR